MHPLHDKFYFYQQTLTLVREFVKPTVSPSSQSQLGFGNSCNLVGICKNLLATIDIMLDCKSIHMEKYD
jgi:hypothetical protein